MCSDSGNQLYLSMVSPWEIQIKQQLGKLKFQSPLSRLINIQIEQNDLNLLPIQLNHIYALCDLPHIHKDPFDRLLIAQSRVESMKLVSTDKKFQHYSVEVIREVTKNNLPILLAFWPVFFVAAIGEYSIFQYAPIAAP